MKNTNRNRLHFWDKEIIKTCSIEFEKIFVIKTKVSPDLASNTSTISISISPKNTITIYINFLIRNRAIEF